MPKSKWVQLIPVGLDKLRNRSLDHHFKREYRFLLIQVLRTEGDLDKILSDLLASDVISASTLEKITHTNALLHQYLNQSDQISQQMLKEYRYIAYQNNELVEKSKFWISAMRRITDPASPGHSPRVFSIYNKVDITSFENAQSFFPNLLVLIYDINKFLTTAETIDQREQYEKISLSLQFMIKKSKDLIEGIEFQMGGNNEDIAILQEFLHEAHHIRKTLERFYMTWVRVSDKVNAYLENQQTINELETELQNEIHALSQLERKNKDEFDLLSHVLLRDHFNAEKSAPDMVFKLGYQLDDQEQKIVDYLHNDEKLLKTVLLMHYNNYVLTHNKVESHNKPHYTQLRATHCWQARINAPRVRMPEVLKQSQILHKLHT